MKLRSILALIVTALSALYLTSCTQCTEQHDPGPDHARFKTERQQANADQPKLTKEGKIPEKKVAVAEGGEEAGGNSAQKKYAMFCVTCHGADGAAASATAQAMNPKPRNFTDAAWQGSVDDARIAKVIKEGGASVGLSATMAPWGALLSDEEINGMVEMIRGFKK